MTCKIVKNVKRQKRLSVTSDWTWTRSGTAPTSSGSPHYQTTVADVFVL